jgi:hypothetical protein
MAWLILLSGKKNIRELKMLLVVLRVLVWLRGFGNGCIGGDIRGVNGTA